MKHLKTIVLLLVAAFMLASCEKEEVTYLPDSHWLLHVDGATEGHRLGLTFIGQELTVRDAGWNNTPFSNDTWDYHISKDGRMYISRDVYDSDGYSYTDGYTFSFSINEDQTQMTLVYKALFGSIYSYTFDRR